MILTSEVFNEGQPIPSMHTCDGQDVSPALSWSDIPPQTRTLTLICDDPDAPRGTWVHWVYFNIPPEAPGLPAHIPADPSPMLGGTQGKNDFGRLGYGGPCPPGGTHRYFFRLYALDARLDLAPGATRKDLEKAMKGHVVARTELMGTYRRR